jgi:uncharacterized DUF497 family protein
MYIHNCHGKGVDCGSVGTNERIESTGESTASVLKPQPWSLTIPRHISHLDCEVEGELRWHTIGMVKGIHVLLVVHTSPGSDNEEEEENIRIISARKATPQERRVYAQGE